ncbi:carbohydrate kinase [Micrococcus sp.]|uniref:carbohydrate kinase family protein n=1 Tax=Micrococcus sp. TaxID=1271 RepID=UPI002A90869F|nr:carbohydrate kinase [Micrococcus sp.]MDY6055984.1 carbohydrate kinase [Micrococcus sp.]
MVEYFGVIGEALVDVVLSDTATPRAHVGGSPLNVAVGLSRLERPVRFAGRYGQDDYGRMIDAHLHDNGVRSVLEPDTTATSVATARLDPTGAASYEFELDWTLPRVADLQDRLSPDAGGGRLLHVHAGSIATMLAPGDAAVMGLLEALQPSTTISYDPNVRPSIVPDRAFARARAEESVRLSDVVHASDEDVAWLYPDRPLLESLRAWQQAGPALVVMTRGAEDIVAVTAEHEVQRPIVPVDVADTVGAGDSFTAALLAALDDRRLLGAENRSRLHTMDLQDIQSVLIYSSRASAITSSRQGANPPTRAELAD